MADAQTDPQAVWSATDRGRSETVSLVFSIPEPTLQVRLAALLRDMRGRYLKSALMSTVATLDIAQIDQALNQYVPEQSLAALAGYGLRGELMFPVPPILAKNPYLLGYYRLLYGFSQKQFYSTDTGAGPFKPMEANGRFTDRHAEHLPKLCEALIPAGVRLLAGIEEHGFGGRLLEDLTVLSVGPQLRGGINAKRGVAEIENVIDEIHEIVKQSVVDKTPSRIVLLNAAGRRVFIETAPDPDITIRQEMAEGELRTVVAMEVKGGSDFSNIHNRIGEAEKSHQKARAAGYVECWTVVNVDRFDEEMAQRESPSTDRFYRISDLSKREGAPYSDFRNRIISLAGIVDQSDGTQPEN